MSFKNDDDWKEGLLWSFGRAGLVLLGVTFLLILSAFPFRTESFGDVRPMFLVMFVYYWSIMRPEIAHHTTVHYTATFASGLALDLVSGGPLGLHGLILVAVQWVSAAQRKFLLGQAFRVLWLGLLLVSLAAGTLQWLLSSLFYFKMLPPLPMLISVLLTAAVFPLFVPGFALLNKALDRDGKA